MIKKISPTWAVILAAGQGSRLAKAAKGVRKQFLEYKGAPLYFNSARTMSRIPKIKGLVFVFPPHMVEEMGALTLELAAGFGLGLPVEIAAGGERRQDSVYNGLRSLPGDVRSVLVHDAARPFATASMIQELILALESGAKGVVPAVPVKDTVKQVDKDTVVSTLKRSSLAAVQTPQGFDLATLVRAHEAANEQGWEVTDDASMLEQMGETVTTVMGAETNVKITTPEDLELIRDKKEFLPCTGWGYDVHRFGPGRPMVLGGVPVPAGPEVVAHSDGDVLLHALADALLGLVAAGDIGKHFPDSDAEFDNISSGILVKEVLALVQKKKIRLTHVDMTVMAQVPKLSPYRDQIAKNVASLLGMPLHSVNFKATTEEKLGFTGEKKGIKAVACVSALKPENEAMGPVSVTDK